MKNYSFTFQIGQIVYHRLAVQNDYHPDKKPARTPLLIIERVVTECVGGVQLSYNCRLGCSANGSTVTMQPDRMFNFNEIELEA